MAKGRKDESAPGFEESLARLEEIVEEMEAGDLPLERAMALFEEGVALGTRCNAQLEEAEKRITILLERADATVEEKDFDPATDAVEARAARPRATPSRRAPARPVPPLSPLEEDDEEDIPF